MLLGFGEDTTFVIVYCARANRENSNSRRRGAATRPLSYFDANFLVRSGFRCQARSIEYDTVWDETKALVGPWDWRPFEAC